MPDLIDLLGAMADYFEARNELAKRRAEYDGYSFDYWARFEIEEVERRYQRVQEEWAKLFPAAALREAAE